MLRPDSAEAQRRDRRTFLGSLVRDTRGNTLALAAAGLIPLTMMIGSGIEMSRAYMARTRLQSACDAASLAGRRVMKDDKISTEVTSEATKFFNFNFEKNLYQTSDITPVISRPRAGTVKVAAETKLPSAIMFLFGFKEFNLKVECEASQNFVNTDVVLVLDVTGSMDETLAGSKKIVALREAVMALYDELAPVQQQLEGAGMRLRYGVVPYSSAVNVGQIVTAASPGYIADSWTYQSRQPVYLIDSPRSQKNVTKGWCDNQDNWSWSRNSSNSDQGTCTYTVEEESYSGTADQFDHWEYKEVSHDTSKFKTFGSTPLPTRTPGTNSTSTWTGCIEERDTVSTITSGSSYTIPAGAHDLQINEMPTSDATRWGPHWPQVEYSRNSTPDDNGSSISAIDPSSGYYACPAKAVRLKAFSKSDMQNYVNSLQPIGGTYHDIGMIWGARLISAGGIFGGDNPTTYKSMPVAKHIIFMTDGQLAPNRDSYTSYGLEELDKRVTGGSLSDQYNRHEQRFKMICRAAKSVDNSADNGREIFIWVIAFGTTTTPALEECASSPNHISVSTNKEQLIAKFTEIGKNIGALRLTQ